MRLNKISISTAAVLGLTGVITGALGAHALEGVLTPEQLDSYETAVRFQMYHALAILALGALAYGPKIKGLSTVYWLWTIGTLLFSGSIYLLVLTPAKVGIVTPIGGLVLIAGWAALLIWAIRKA